MQIKFVLRDLALVAITCGLCLLATYTANHILTRQQEQQRVDRLLRRLQRDREAKEKMLRELAAECKECREA